MWLGVGAEDPTVFPFLKKMKAEGDSIYVAAERNPKVNKVLTQFTRVLERESQVLCGSKWGIELAWVVHLAWATCSRTELRRLHSVHGVRRGHGNADRMHIDDGPNVR